MSGPPPQERALAAQRGEGGDNGGQSRSLQRREEAEFREVQGTWGTHNKRITATFCECHISEQPGNLEQPWRKALNQQGSRKTSSLRGRQDSVEG
ncbi:unnamed protein product [Boreogadus saida]